jgi:hypothetical protein
MVYNIQLLFNLENNFKIFLTFSIKRSNGSIIAMVHAEINKIIEEMQYFRRPVVNI